MNSPCAYGEKCQLGQRDGPQGQEARVHLASWKHPTPKRRLPMSDVGASFTRGLFNPVWRKLCSGEDLIALGSIVATAQLGAFLLPQNGSHQVAISSSSSRSRSR